MTHIIVEKRGGKITGGREDNELELEFRRVCDGNNLLEIKLPFKLEFADKKANLIGLQFADLVARPIGLSILRPDQNNRAEQILITKYYKDNNNHIGFGLKCFPLN